MSSSWRFRRLFVIVILSFCVCRMQSSRIENFKDLSLRTGTCKMVLDNTRWRGLSPGTKTLSLGTLPLSLGPIALRDIWWRNVFSWPYLVRRAYAAVLRPSVVCRLSVRNVLWLNGASYSKSYYWQPLESRIWEIDWYQNEWPWLFRGCINVNHCVAFDVEYLGNR